VAETKQARLEKHVLLLLLYYYYLFIYFYLFIYLFIFALQHTVISTGGTLRRLAICHTNNSPKHFKHTYMIYDRYMQQFSDCN